MGIIKKASNPERNRKLRNTIFAASMIAVCVLLYAVFGGEKAETASDVKHEKNEGVAAIAVVDDFLERSELEGFTFMGRSRNDMVYSRGQGDVKQTLVLSVLDDAVVSFVLRLPVDRAVDEAKGRGTASAADNGGEAAEAGSAPGLSLILGDLEKLEEGEFISPDEEAHVTDAPVGDESSNMQLITKLITALDKDETLNFADMETIRLCIEEAEDSDKKRTKKIGYFDLTAYVDKNELLILMDSDKS